MLRFSTHQAPDGEWHTGYTIPGTNILSVVGVGCSERSARADAARLNREQADKNVPHVEPRERRIPAGFYEDSEAA